MQRDMGNSYLHANPSRLVIAAGLRRHVRARRSKLQAITALCVGFLFLVTCITFMPDDVRLKTTLRFGTLPFTDRSVLKNAEVKNIAESSDLIASRITIAEESVRAADDFFRDITDVSGVSSMFKDDKYNYHLLIDHARIAPVFVNLFTPDQRQRLLRQLTEHTGGIVSASVIPRLLIVHVQNGLGNRLRAMCSAMELAFRSKRVLIVIWARDPHLEATMHDLFDEQVLNKLIIVEKDVSWPLGGIDKRTPQAMATIPDARFTTTYNHMEKDISEDMGTRFLSNARHPPRNRPHYIYHEPTRHIYVKTAYELDSMWASQAVQSALLRSLIPSRRVRMLVRNFEMKHGNLSKMVGVHVRSLPISRDNVRVDVDCEYSRRSARVTDKWRGLSTPDKFIRPMRALLPRHWKGTRFLVATDDPSTMNLFGKAIGREYVTSIERNCTDRSARCAIYAFADIIALSKTQLILGSPWSSFTEAAARLMRFEDGVSYRQEMGRRVLLSGVHFGVPSKWGKMYTSLRRQLAVRKMDNGDDLRHGAKEQRRIACANMRREHGDSKIGKQ